MRKRKKNFNSLNNGNESVVYNCFNCVKKENEKEAFYTTFCNCI